MNDDDPLRQPTRSKCGKMFASAYAELSHRRVCSTCRRSRSGTQSVGPGKPADPRPEVNGSAGISGTVRSPEPEGPIPSPAPSVLADDLESIEQCQLEALERLDRLEQIVRDLATQLARAGQPGVQRVSDSPAGPDADAPPVRPGSTLATKPSVGSATAGLTDAAAPPSGPTEDREGTPQPRPSENEDGSPRRGSSAAWREWFLREAKEWRFLARSIHDSVSEAAKAAVQPGSPEPWTWTHLRESASESLQRAKELVKRLRREDVVPPHKIIQVVIVDEHGRPLPESEMEDE